MTTASTITATLSRHAREAPDRPAVVCDNHAVSWRDLDQAVNRLAGHLAKVVPAGRGVALHLPNGPALVLLFLAACRVGREAQILDPSWPTETARLAITALSPGIVVSGDAALAAGPRSMSASPRGPPGRRRDIAATINRGSRVFGRGTANLTSARATSFSRRAR